MGRGQAYHRLTVLHKLTSHAHPHGRMRIEQVVVLGLQLPNRGQGRFRVPRAGHDQIVDRGVLFLR